MEGVDDARGQSRIALFDHGERGDGEAPAPLSGESDFHALDYAHGTVYDCDATNSLLRTTKDGTTWKDAARREALDIAVSPNDPGLILATTETVPAKYGRLKGTDRTDALARLATRSIPPSSPR
ncbi:hypothetical protein ACIP6X_22600 [Streptomyces coeruleorubidus]|uniref:hypothetical protein n=1 Tax=Streptomyces coeruleorubidus TaxID=116188 RepID=UPI003805F0F1